MSERGTQLLETANRQIFELISLLSTQGESALKLPCPGREKLGDGTLGATASHVANVYHLLARFLQANGHMLGTRAGSRPGRGDSSHTDEHGSERIDLQRLLQQLSDASSAVSPLADISDEHLSSVPPAGSFRFCDGHRTVEQVITNSLNHQSHHIDALKTAVTSEGPEPAG